MKDRVPQKPGRVKITPEGGAPYFAVMERADEPVEMGTPLNKATLLTDETAKSIGLDITEDPTVDDAFSGMMDLLYGGTAIVRLITKTGDGRVMPGVPISGAKTISGATPITDEKGVVYIALSGNTATTVHVGDVIDLTGSVSITAAPFVITEKILTVSVVNYREITSSSVVRVSGACTRLDVCCVGGGGGGGYPGTSSGGGGGGGHAVTQEKVSFLSNTGLIATVGAGGTGSSNWAVPAGTGGSTSILGVMAPGGGGATEGTPGAGNGAGGAGRTLSGYHGGPGANGTEYGYSGFTTTALYGGGGGGGAWATNNSVNYSGGSGGTPYGGAGGSAMGYGATAAGSASPGSGGGGGGASMAYMGNPGSVGNGGSGKICLRMWHGEENT